MTASICFIWKCPTVEESARHGQDHSRWSAAKLPNLWSASNKKKVAWKECIFRWCSYKPWGTACWGWNLGSILDGFGRFFSLRMSAVMCFLSSLVSLRKHGGPYTMTMLWSGLVWGQKNARFSHAIHRRHSWFAFLFVEIIAPLKFGSTSQYPSYIDPQKKLKHWMWPGNLRTVPSGCKQKKKPSSMACFRSSTSWASFRTLKTKPPAGYSGAGDLQLLYEKVILNHLAHDSDNEITILLYTVLPGAYAILPTLGPKRVRLPRAASHHVLNPDW